MKKRRKSRVYY